MASANAQDSTGAPVSFHPGRDPESPFEIMRIFSEAGGNPKRAICSHLESKFSVKSKLPDLLEIILLYTLWQAYLNYCLCFGYTGIY